MDEAGPIGKAAKAASTSDAYWIGGWAALNEQGKIVKMLCEWDAKDVQTIRGIMNKIPNLPVDGIWPMAKVDGESFR
jgi:hypothetical protein